MAVEHASATELAWPELPLADWKDTRDTLHMWTQIVGKVRLALSPHMNHWWESPLYVDTRGLTTSPIPYGEGMFEICFDFHNHELNIQTDSDETRSVRLVPQSVADFHREFVDALQSLGIHVGIWPMPVEVPDPIRFDRDQIHAAYDPEYAHRFWRALVSIDSIFKEFRARFIGKASPVHFFWGSFDLAATRFSGRRAPERKQADPVTREAYSHEVISSGFWPGGDQIKDAAFYTYASPEPAGFRDAIVRPAEAFYSPQLSEFILMYEDVRRAHSPRAALLRFLESTYDAAATLAAWDRDNLERRPTVTAPV